MIDVDEDALRAAFKAHAEGQDKFTRRMAVTIADLFSVRPMGLVWKLEKMGLLKPGSWDWFQSNGGITADNIKEARAARIVTCMLIRLSPKETKYGTR